MTKTLIVGGGIGGMAAGIKLSELGHAVELIDIDPKWRVYGAGITITGPTLRAYKHLSMVDDIASEGAITNGTRIFKFDGKFLRELDEPPLEEGLPATGGIMRPVLHNIMQRQVRELDIPVRLGTTVDALESDDGGVDVAFSDNSSGRYDLVIGADSIYSKVRELAFPHAVKPPFTGQGCLRVSMQRPPDFDRGEFYFGHERPAGITACGPNSCYMFMLLRDDKREYWPDEELYERAHELMAPFGGNIGWMRENMTKDDWINYRPLEAAIQPRPWHTGRITLLGDSAHATTPHLASGAGMAVESAIVLGEELQKTGGDILAALDAYEERRFERCRDVVESSLEIGEAQLRGAGPEEVGKLIGGALHRLAAPF
ncbi:MAG: FAD-dependent monooxygenase [Rhodospirillaceae bacterium]|nr:FAD-dependent monooxygenase [Rhodospirillaceae bacterium]